MPLRHQKFPLKTRGHKFYYGEEENPQVEVMVADPEFEAWYKAKCAEDGTEYTPLDSLHVSPSRNLYSMCSDCGEHIGYHVVDGFVQPKNEPCDAPAEGYRTEIFLKVPSGKMVVADSLSHWGYWVDTEVNVDGVQWDAKRIAEMPNPWVGKFASYNSAKGQSQVVEAHAEIGCAYGPVGNSCPGIYKNPQGVGYVIANLSEDDEALYGESLASVCTDLWAYSIVDYDDFFAHGGTEEDLRSLDVMEVEPGTYKFVHHTGERGFNDEEWEKTTLYAHFERVGD